jgi:metal-responsive CopG/Arc/MetJ family transcriptional regulator
MRHKIPDDKKKEKMTITIDNEIVSLFENYLEENNITNRSKYIERLIIRDMEERGEKIIKNF